MKFLVLLIAILTSASPALAYPDEYETPKTWLEGYRSNYFLYGNPDSKIQLSAKTQLFRERRLYFAYSQTMFWNIRQNSSPIADVNFNPEFFYRLDFDQAWLDLGIFEHESNGKSGADSRSWDRSYVRYVLESRFENDVRIYSSFKLWLPYRDSFDAGNTDLLEYRGLYELNFTVANLFNVGKRRSDVTLRLFAGGKSHINPFQGGQELTFRFGTTTDYHFVPLWTLQIFNGAGESLLDYKDSRTIVRAGLSF